MPTSLPTRVSRLWAWVSDGDGKLHVRRLALGVKLDVSQTSGGYNPLNNLSRGAEEETEEKKDEAGGQR